MLAGAQEGGTSPKRGKFYFKVLHFVAEMYVPLGWVVSKRCRNNVFLKAPFYTLLDNVTD